jgi:hypothetical protein
MDEHSNEWTSENWHLLQVYLDGSIRRFKTYCGIVVNVCEYNVFLVQWPNCTRKFGLSSIQKYTTMFQQLAYGIGVDSIDE